MTAEPNTTSRLPSRLRVVLPVASPKPVKAWAERRPDIAPDLYGWACACGRFVLYWTAWRDEDGKVQHADTTAQTQEMLLQRSIEARVREHVVRQKKRQALVQAAAKEPNDWQQRKAPTIPVMVWRTAQRRVQQRARRRLLDARLWNNLTDFQQDSAQCIGHGYELVTAGLGQRCQAFKPREISAAEALDARHRQPTKGQVKLMDAFIDWSRRAEKQRVDVEAALEVLTDNRSCSAVDKARRRQNGWARENLVAGLNIYCEIRGWPTSRCA